MYKVFVNDKPISFETFGEFKEFCQQYKSIDAAGGIVFNKKKEILCILRLGKWDLPKGKMEKGEDAPTTAIREVEEECCITGLKILKPAITTYHTYSLHQKKILKTTFWFVMKYNGDEIPKPQTEENITETRWFSQGEVRSVVLNNTFASIKEVLGNVINPPTTPSSGG